jgi:uncharacterized protein with FMN-binding domain
MRRAVIVLGTTAAGIAALFSYKTHVAGVADASTSTTPTVSAPPMTSSNGSSPAASPSATAKKKAAPKPSSSATAPTMTSPATTKSGSGSTPTTAPSRTAPSKTPSSSSTPKTSPSTAPAGPSGTFDGPSESTQYGNVQVTITVANGKITNANGSLPGGGDSIGQNAIPQLNQEVLTAQSANIQAVSGATYTSNGYIESLQQAVDQAGL